MIRLDGLSVRAGEFEVRDISLDVPEGGYALVIGPTGSGKTTLLEAVAGHVPLLGGRVHLHGQDVTDLPPEARGVGFVYQHYQLFPHLSVRDNLLFALPAGARAARVQAAERALDEAGLAGFGERLPGSLSGGQRARVSLLRALLAAPAALLLDEPFGKLDTALREQMREFTFTMLAARQVPALLVTHDAADIPAGARTIRLDTDA